MICSLLKLRFPASTINEPISANLVRKFDLTFSILKATIYPRPSMEVGFDKGKCSACELCVPACPAHAMEVRFDKALLD